MRRRTVSGVGASLRGAVVGIALSLVPLLVVLVVADGLIEGIVDRYLEVGTYHIQVELTDRTPLDARGLAALAEVLAALPATTTAVAERRGNALLAAASRRLVVEVRAVPATVYVEDAGFQRFVGITAGAFDLQNNGAVLSAEVARTLGVQVGDALRLVTTRTGSLDGGPPRLTLLEVRGIFSTGYQELDKLWAFVSLGTGAAALPTNARQLVGVKVADPRGDLDPLVRELTRLVGPLGRVVDWRRAAGATLQSFDSSRALLLFVMAMIVVVATVNVASATVSISLSRRQEVAYLKSMGLPPVAVFSSLTLAGALAGIAGATLGVLLGLLVAININEVLLLLESAASWLRDIVLPATVTGRPPVTLVDRSFYLERVPVSVGVREVVAVASGAVALATLAAALPAASAAGSRPLAVLNRSA